MAITSNTASVTRHKDWPLTLERMTQYMQALQLSVSKQSQTLADVIRSLDENVIADDVGTQAMKSLRVTLQGSSADVNQQIVANHYGFSQQRDLKQRHWSMPAMKRSSMQPNRRPDPVEGQWTHRRAKPNAT